MDLKPVLRRMSELLVAGVVGGIVSSLLTPSSAALAQGKRVTKGAAGEESTLEVVKAKNFQLVDTNGKKRAQLSITRDVKGNDIGSRLSFFDLKGNELVETGYVGGMGFIFLRNDQASAQVNIAAQDSPARGSVSVLKGATNFGLAEATERIEIEASDDPLGVTGLKVARYGTTRASISADKDGPSVSLFDPDGKIRAAFGTTKLELPGRGGSTEVRSPASVVLFSKDGAVLWSAPH